MSAMQFGLRTQRHHIREHDNKPALDAPGATTPESFRDFEVSGAVPINTS